MKEGWEIKKLGEVAGILNGFAFDSKLFTDDSKYKPLIRIRDIKRGYTETFYKGDFSEYYLVKKKDLLIGMDGEFNIAEWKSDDALLNQRVCKIIPNPKDILQGYLLWYLPIVLKAIEDATSFVTVKHLSSRQLQQLPIPVPPLPTQERIVSELDCINSIIEKKREQLKELDALAQSIFYDMFGDPIHNKKGWEVRKFSECYKLRSGKGLSAKEIIEGIYPVYGGNGIVGFHNEYNLEGENIIIGRVGALCGNVRNVLGKMFVTDNAFILSKNIENDNVFLQYLLTAHNLRQYAREAMQPVISNTSLKNVNIIIPPLPLQQSFASKIEAIEKQKELIKHSIAETETLLASRMQYYFVE